MRLRDKVAVIAGAGDNMGRAVPLLFAQEGARQVLVSRNEAALQETAADLPDPQDPLARSFFRALELHLGRGHRLGEPLDALIRALTRELVERTEARAALCRRQAGLYGVAAVVGMVIAIVLPAVGLLLGGRP